MHSYRSFLFFLVILITPLLHLRAQDQGTQILEAARRKLLSLGDFTASFRYEITTPAAKPVVSTGEISYKQGKYVLRLPDQVVYCDLNTIWIYLTSESQVHILPYSPANGPGIEGIVALYGGPGTVRYDGDAEWRGASFYKISITIHDSYSEYSQAYLWINKKTQMAERITLVNRKQSTTTYEFSDVRTNNGIEDSAFRLEPSRLTGVNVMDRR
ncbi:MAG: outer membrane lipoprotein carrier protein LolA [Bacteroidetes bacterium]|nr:MAG: outer membrane lipoprotein carrier protein LolA [Bacteroidota bacterium]